jgi:hypothetical protein
MAVISAPMNTRRNDVAFMNAVPDGIAEKAAGIQRRLNQSVAAVQSNDNLSAEGRRKQLATDYLDAMTAMKKLRESLEAEEEQTADDLSVDLFGSASSLGADAISVRDADDRAAQLKTKDEALALLTRAESNGDQVLARAIALRAFTKAQQPLGGSAWASVLDTYTASRPVIATKMAKLAEARRSSVEKSFGRSIIFSPNKPRELERMSDSQIQAAAGGAFSS